MAGADMNMRAPDAVLEPGPEALDPVGVSRTLYPLVGGMIAS